MSSKPGKHRRFSMRHPKHDYSRAGLYYVTGCSQNKTCFFGKIVDGEMILNDAGKMIEKWYRELENKFPDIKCEDWILMPNHFHCIIRNTSVIVETESTNNQNSESVTGDIANSQAESPYGEFIDRFKDSALSKVMQWFKTMATNEYIRGVKDLDWPPFNRKLWQRSFFDRIIRDEDAHQNIKKYIRDNPKNWTSDQFFTDDM